MRRLRKSVRKRILVAGACVVVQVLFLFVCQMAVRQLTERKYEAILEEKNAILEAAGRTVYLTRREISAGESFTEENTEKRYLLSEQNPEALAVEVVNMSGDTLYYGMLPDGIVNNIWKYEAGESSRKDNKGSRYEIQGGEIAVIYPGDCTKKEYTTYGIY